MIKILINSSMFPAVIYAVLWARQAMKEPIPITTVPANAQNLYLNMVIYLLLCFVDSQCGLLFA